MKDYFYDYYIKHKNHGLKTFNIKGDVWMTSCTSTKDDKIVIETPLSDINLKELIMNGKRYSLDDVRKVTFTFEAGNLPKLDIEYRCNKKDENNFENYRKFTVKEIAKLFNIPHSIVKNMMLKSSRRCCKTNLINEINDWKRNNVNIVTNDGGFKMPKGISEALIEYFESNKNIWYKNKIKEIENIDDFKKEFTIGCDFSKSNDETVITNCTIDNNDYEEPKGVFTYSDKKEDKLELKKDEFGRVPMMFVPREK